MKEEEEWQIIDAYRPLDGFLVLVLVGSWSGLIGRCVSEAQRRIKRTRQM